MARYDYRCAECAHVFEVEHPMGEKPEVTCPSCGKSAERVFGASGIAFKGTGFYNTDNRPKSTPSAACEGCPSACSHE